MQLITYTAPGYEHVRVLIGSCEISANIPRVKKSRENEGDKHPFIDRRIALVS